MDNDVVELISAIRNALAKFDAMRVSHKQGAKRMTLDHEAWHVVPAHNALGEVVAEMEPNPNCPYCNEGWTDDP